MMTDEEIEQLRAKVVTEEDFEKFCAIVNSKCTERALREPLPSPLRIKGYAKGNLIWCDNFDFVEFTYIDLECHFFDGQHHIYRRADGWLYNIQMDIQGRKHIQFLKPATPEDIFPTQTMYYCLNQMKNAKFVRNTVKPVEVTNGISVII